MTWINDLVGLATAASRREASKRTARAKAKHERVLAGLGGVVSSQILKDRLGLKHPHDTLKVMVRLGLIRKVRRVPAHFEYEVIQQDPQS